MNTFGRDFVRAYLPSAQQAAENYDQQNNMRLQMALQQQMAQDSMKRNFAQQAAQYGVQPIMDDKGDLDMVATGAAIQRQKLLQDGLEQDQRIGKERKAAIQADADAYGVAADPEAVRQAKVAEQMRQKQEMADYNAGITRDNQKFQADLQRTLAVDKPTAAQKNAEAAVDAAIKVGQLKPEDRDAALAIATGNQGRLPQLDKTVQDEAGFQLAILNGLAPQVQRVQALGDKAPDYFGPMDARIRNLQGAVFGQDPTFRAINQGNEEISSGRAFAQGGKALTQVELDRILSQVGKLTDADYSSRLGQYYQRAIRDAALARDRIAKDPAFYGPEGRAYVAQLDAAIERANGVLGAKKQDAQAAGSAPQVRYDKNGKAWTRDANGNVIPYNG